MLNQTNLCAAPAARTTTPPDLKWLLNERAALAGRQAGLDSSIAYCRDALLKLNARMREMEATLAARQVARDEITERVLSFDTVIGLAYRTVRPDAGGVVNAWAGRYGARGALRQFLVDSAKAAHPRAVTTEAIVSAVIQQFSIAIGTPQELRKLRDCVRTRLSEMQRKDGFLTSHKIGKTTRAWRWSSGPTMLDLVAKAAVICGDAADEGANSSNSPCSSARSASASPSTPNTA